MGEVSHACLEVWSLVSYCPRSSLPAHVLEWLGDRLAHLVPPRPPGQGGTPPLSLEVRSREVLVLFNPEYDPDTYSVSNGRIMADFVVGRQAVIRDEVAAWTRDLEQLGREGDYFFSLNRYLFQAEKPRP